MLKELSNINKTNSKVFVLRPDHLGDVILFSGFLKYFKVLFPEFKIILSVKRYVKNLVELCPHIDEIIDYEKLSSIPLNFLPNIRGKYRLNWILRNFLNKRYKSDIILLPVRSPTGGLFGMHNILHTIPASEKIGIRGDFTNQTPEQDEAVEPFYTRRLNLGNEQKKFEIEINKKFLKFLGLNFDSEDIWPDFWTSLDDLDWAKNSVPIKDGLMNLGICPGVTSSLYGKYYPAENYAQAISNLNEISFLAVIFGSPAEKDVCNELENSLSRCINVIKIINLSGKSTIRQMIEGIRRCNLIISAETAALHICVALRKPSVGIIGGGHYGRFYPWGDKKINRAANKQMDCYWCNWNCIYDTFRCIHEIHPQMIEEQMRLALFNSRSDS
jgi:ADP-heptose:LPS heptosyltransferase